MKTIYRTIDGKEFESKVEANAHEKDALIMYCVVPAIGADYLQSCSFFIREELAKNYISENASGTYPLILKAILLHTK